MFQKLYPQNIITFYLIAVCIVVICGVIPSVISTDWGWFSRSGALLIVYGLFMIFSDLSLVIHSLEKQNEILSKKRTALDQLEKWFDDVHKNGNGLAEYSYMKSEVEKSSKELVDEKEIKGKIVKFQVNFKRLAEFIVPILGTFIWAYGDLVCYIFGSCSC